VHTIAITIVLSVVAHGLTSRPIAGQYLAAIAAPPPTTNPTSTSAGDR